MPQATCSRSFGANWPHFVILLVAMLATVSAQAEEYLRFRGISVEKEPGQPPTHLYDAGKKAVVRKYFHDLAAREGTTVPLEQFAQRNWPHLKSEFARDRGKLEGRIAMLEEYTSRSMTQKLSPAEFYDQVIAERGRFPHFSNKEQWLIFQRNTPLEGAREGLRRFPTTAEAGLATYGRHVQLENFRDAWTLRELEKRKAGLARALAPEIPLSKLPTGPGQVLPEEARREHARRKGLISESAERLVLPQVVEEIEFGSPADRNAFLKFMEQELAMPLSPELPAEVFRRPK